MLEKLVKNWQISGFEQIAHKSLHYLIGNGVFLHLYTFGNKLNQKLESGSLAKNILEHCVDNRPHVPIVGGVFGCPLHCLVSLLE